MESVAFHPMESVAFHPMDSIPSDDKTFRRLARFGPTRIPFRPNLKRALDSTSMQLYAKFQRHACCFGKDRCEHRSATCQFFNRKLGTAHNPWATFGKLILASDVVSVLVGVFFLKKKYSESSEILRVGLLTLKTTCCIFGQRLNKTVTRFLSELFTRFVKVQKWPQKRDNRQDNSHEVTKWDSGGPTKPKTRRIGYIPDLEHTCLWRSWKHCMQVWMKVEKCNMHSKTS